MEEFIAILVFHLDIFLNMRPCKEHVCFCLNFLMLIFCVLLFEIILLLVKIIFRLKWVLYIF